MTIANAVMYEVEISEPGMEPDYRFFSDERSSLDFMREITSQIQVVQMKWVRHELSADAEGFAGWLNQQRQAPGTDELPF